MEHGTKVLNFGNSKLVVVSSDQ